MPGIDFLDGEKSPAVDVPVSDAEIPAPEVSEGPARGPDGKFVAQTPAETPAEPVEAQATEPAPVAPPAPEPAHAPITALLDEREKRQAAERRAQEIEARLRAYEQQQQVSVPDAYDDPEGFATFQQQQIEQRIYATNLQWSRRIAEVQHTPQVVAQAHEWGVERCNTDPFFNQKVQSSPDPYGFVIDQWKREQLLAEVKPDDLEQFRAWKAQMATGAPQPQPVAQVRASTPPPPPSLASAPSAGGAAHVPVGAGRAYDSVFK